MTDAQGTTEVPTPTLLGRPLTEQQSRQVDNFHAYLAERAAVAERNGTERYSETDYLISLLLDRNATIDRMTEQRDRDRESFIEVGREREREHVIERTFAYDRGCEEGKRDYLTRQLGYDVPPQRIDWEIEVTLTYRTMVEGDAEDGPEGDDFDSGYVASTVAAALGLSRHSVEVEWETT